MKKNFWKRSIAVPLVTAMLISQCHIVFAKNLDSSASENPIISEEERIEGMQAKMLATVSSAQEESIQADDRANIAIKRRDDNVSNIDKYFEDKKIESSDRISSSVIQVPDTSLQVEDEQGAEQTSSNSDEEDELIPTNSLIPKYYIAGNNDSIISTSTGDLVRIEKIAELPVAGDITLSLNLKYDSSTPAFSGDELPLYALRTCPVYEVAAGWGFDIPYIRESTLYIPELGTYELNSSDGKVYFNNTEVKYLSFYKRRRSGVEYIDVYTKDGVTYSFTNYKINKVTDKYNNYVSYSVNSDNKLSGITDSLGRNITITYNNQVNGDVTIILPNTQTIVLDREREPNNHVTLLTEVKRSVDNNTFVSSQYEYTLTDGLYDDYFGNEYIPAALLTYAVNTQYGANYYYYEAVPSLSYTLSYGFQLDTAFRIKENNIVDSDGNTVDWIYYDYEGSPTGYTSDTNTSDIPETYTYSVHVHGNISSTKYEYTVTAPKEDENGYIIHYENRVKYYTHKKYEDYKAPVNENDTESYYSLTEYTYTEAMSYPSSIVTTYPGLNNASLTEKYVYDDWKNTVLYLSPKSPTTDHTLASAAPYKTIYTYSAPYTADAARGLTDTVTYNMLLSTQYMTDANTTVKTTNTLSADNKSVASIVTTVNNVTKDKVDYTYDSKGNILSEKKYPDVSDTTVFYLTEYAYTYDPYLKKIVITDDSTDIFTQSEYDNMGNVLSVKDEDGYITRYEYDGIGRVTKETLPNGAVLNYTHNSSSSVYDTIYGFKRQVFFDGFGNVKYIYKLNADGEVAVIEAMYNHLNLAGKPTETFVFSENTAFILDESYDKLGRYLGWSRESEASRYNWYSSEYTEAETAALAADSSVVYSYSALTIGNNTVWCNVTTTYKNDIAVERQYTNIYGEVVMSCSVLNGQNIGEIYYEYDKNSRLIYKYYEKANGTDVTIARYTYDYRGNVLTEKNFDNNTKSTTYDSLGRVLTDSDFKGKFVQYEYDSLDRVTRQITPLSGDIKSITEYEYDGRGNVVKQRVSNNPDNSSVVTYRLTENVYDNMGNLTDVTIYNGTQVLSSVHYTYNAAGQVTKMYEGLNQLYTTSTPSSAYKLTSYAYDYWGNPYTVTYANSGVDTTVYNAYNQLVHSYVRGGMHHEYTYDMLGRQVDDIYGVDDGELLTGTDAYRYSYNLDDLVTAIDKYNVENYNYVDDVYYDYKVGNEVTYTYDTLGRSTSETSSVNNKAVVKSFTYDEFGNKTRDVITLAGTQIYDKASTYDEFLRLETVAQGGKTTTYTYDANGNIATEITGDAETIYSYNDANMVVIMTTLNGYSPKAHFEYNYYTDGNQRTQNDILEGITTTYTYDAAGQLISEFRDGYTDQTDLYTYDASGNRIQKVEQRPNNANKTITSTYNNMNQLVSSVDSSTNNATTYTYDIYGNLVNDGEYIYTYDSYFNRLYSVRNIETNGSVYYEYYVDGLRKSKGNTYFIWLDGNMVYEFTGSDSNTYTYGHRLLYSDDYKYVLNAHGDVVSRLDSIGDELKRYKYDAFGNELNPSASDTNPFRYCAEYFDVETGQIYLRNRYYQPVTGRFTQLDPIRDGLNWYAYCYNNPIVFIDSNGLDAIWLQYEDGVPVVGHTGALIQDNDGNWYLFYWGTNESRLAAVASSSLNHIGDDKVLQKIGSYSFGDSDLTKQVNDFLTQYNEKLGGVSDCLYFKGDFQESIDYIQDELDDGTKYNLYTNNCLQFTVRALKKGDFSKYSTEYEYIFNQISGNIIPNSTFNELKDFVNYTKKYYNTNKKTRKWMLTPQQYHWFNHLVIIA